MYDFFKKMVSSYLVKEQAGENYDSESIPSTQGTAAPLTSKCLVKLSLNRLTYLKQKPVGLNHPSRTTSLVLTSLINGVSSF